MNLNRLINKWLLNLIEEESSQELDFETCEVDLFGNFQLSSMIKINSIGFDSQKK